MRARMVSVGITAVVFLVLAAGTPFSQSTVEDRVFTAHGGGINLVSRIDPITDLYIGSKDVGTMLVDMFPHTSKLNPTWLIAASQAGGLYRLSTNQGVISKIVNTQGTVIAAHYVAPGQGVIPHYVCAENYTGTTSSAMIEFMDIDGAAVNETFVTGSFGDRFTDVTFTHTDVGLDGNPSNDYWRWWFSNLSPLGSATDSLWVLDFRYTDILQGDPNDPFNTNPVIPGPPFPKILTQLDGNNNKWFQVANIPSNEDARMRVETWFDTATNTNWVITFNTHFHPGPTPYFDTYVSCFNADQASVFNIAANVEGSSSAHPAPIGNLAMAGSGFSPVFHNVQIVGNYAVVTEGGNPAGSGGTQVTYLWLREVVDGLADGDPGNRGSVILAGADGVGSDVDNMKIYVGCDESNNFCWMMPTQPGTVVGGVGMMADTGALPVNLGGIKTITMLTPLEQNQTNPPNRIYPGRSTVSFRIVTDPTLTFPGQGTGTSSRSKGCLFSASNAASFWGLTVIILAIGMAVIMTRK